jgi:hypothetical protein
MVAALVECKSPSARLALASEDPVRTGLPRRPFLRMHLAGVRSMSKKTRDALASFPLILRTAGYASPDRKVACVDALMAHYGLDPKEPDSDTFIALARCLIEDFVPAFQPTRNKGGRRRTAETPGSVHRDADLVQLVEAARAKAIKAGAPKTIPAICTEIARLPLFRTLSPKTLTRLYYEARKVVEYRSGAAVVHLLWRTTGKKPPPGFMG